MTDQPLAPTGVWHVLRAPQAARVLLASLIGRLPLGAAPLALLVFARERASLGMAALLVAAYTAGVAIGGPALARAADRWRQPPVLWLAVSASTLGFGLVMAAGSLAWLQSMVWAQIVGAALAGLGAPPFEACLRVLWRDLLPATAVPAAYTVDIATQELIFIVGPLATVGAVTIGGPAGGLATAAAAQLVGTVWFATAPAVRQWAGEVAHRHWLGPLRSGQLRVILVAVVLVGLALGSLVVAVTGYAEERGSTSSAGWLISVQAGGALIGGLAYTRLSGRLRRPWRLPVIAALMALSYVPLLTLPPAPGMAALLVLSGLGLPVLLTVGFLTVDRVSPPGTAAEAFAWIGTAFAVGSAAGSALTGVVIDASGSVRIGFLVGPLALAISSLVLTAIRVSTEDTAVSVRTGAGSTDT
jgi:predicted MFS family arabinose efflux permease